MTLIIKELSVSHGAMPALRGVTFEVPEGKIVAVIGANGAGKTTLLRTISGLMRPNSGSISWNGNELSGKRTEQIVRSGIAHVSEGKSVIPELTVKENLLLGSLWRKNRDESVKTLASVYKLFPRIEERLSQRADTLSGGERQRVVLARALAQHTLVLVLDEPTTGLDVRHQVEILDLVRREVDECGLAVVATLHDLSLAAQFSDVLSVMSAGRLVTTGRPADVLRSRELAECYGVDFRVVEVDGSDVAVPHVVREGANRPVS